MTRRKPKAHYHHGDLARALEHEALRIIEKDGLAAVSLRELGRRLGVSRTAPYRHFVDKEALLAMLATRGFEALNDAMLGASIERASTTPAERLDAFAFGYVHFARKQPATFRLIFGRRDFTRVHADLRTSGEAAFMTMKNAVAACQAEGSIAGSSVDEPALLCWTVVHGFAFLLLDGLIPEDAADLALRGALDRLHAGLIPR